MSGHMPRVLPASLAFFAACALAGDDVAKQRARAGISLEDASAAISLTSQTAWTLTKTGVRSGSIVTWTVTATEGPTEPGLLVVNGVITVHNDGDAPATIGNIVVNLQTRQGNQWRSASVDVADATNDDAATTANVHAQASSEGLAVFTENAASGQLLFMDATSNTVFSLVPQVTIGAGETVTLAYAASFDNTVLGLAPGTPVRAEVIVTFGNAGPAGNSTTPNVDIDGSGTIDPDEAWVRSVPSRHGLTVPPEVPGNATPTLSDTIDDITTTGTVTFGDAVFALGPTGGTVQVTVAGGTDGGSITNCAHLTAPGTTITIDGITFPNVGAIDLEACDTQVIGSDVCIPGTPGCGWRDGDLVTYSQGSWGDTPSPTNAAGLLLASYGAVYAATSGVLELGIPGAAGFSIRFTNPIDLLAYLPALGAPGALDSDHVDPLSTASGSFGGDVTALALNIDFGDAGLLAGAADVAFGDLTLCGFAALPALNGLTVRQFEAIVNTLLGGGAAVYSIAELSALTADLTRAFAGGTVTTFAQDHLVNGPCP